MWGNNDVGLHAFVCDEKLDQNITLELKGAKLVTLKMWSNKNVGLYICVSGANQTQGTLKLKGAKLVTSKNVGDNNVQSFVNLKRKSNMN